MVMTKPWQMTGDRLPSRLPGRTEQCRTQQCRPQQCRPKQRTAMTTTAARPGSAPRRGRLTPEAIITESLRLLDADGRDGFSLPKLRRAPGVDPTAVYRHFASKDDL